VKVEKIENRIPLSISSKRKMVRIAISVDGAAPMNLEFTPPNSVPWMIQNFVFDAKLEFHVFGVRGGRISDAELEVEWISIKWPER